MRQPGTVHRFGAFELDEDEMQLRRGGEVVGVNPRYFQALLLLVRNPGTLITKERFFDEVWRGVTVGDEALTQCITSLRKALDDPHRAPRYIATVPKLGYRFVAEVETDAAAAAEVSAPASIDSRWQLAFAGTLGGGAAGAIGGLVYGIGAAGSGGGAISVLFVLMAITFAIGILGALGVGLGMAGATRLLRRPPGFNMLGAGVGGLIVGAGFNLLATDSLNLLFGRAPAEFTGGAEGAILGAALAGGALLGGGLEGRGWRPAIGAGIAGAFAGALISLTGGKLLGGSLVALAAAFDGSRLQLNRIGHLAGEAMFGPVAQAVAAALEGLLFGAFVAGAMLLRHRRSLFQLR